MEDRVAMNRCITVPAKRSFEHYRNTQKCFDTAILSISSFIHENNTRIQEFFLQASVFNRQRYCA